MNEQQITEIAQRVGQAVGAILAEELAGLAGGVSQNLGGPQAGAAPAQAGGVNTGGEGEGEGEGTGTGAQEPLPPFFGGTPPAQGNVPTNAQPSGFGGIPRQTVPVDAVGVTPGQSTTQAFEASVQHSNGAPPANTTAAPVAEVAANLAGNLLSQLQAQGVITVQDPTLLGQFTSDLANEITAKVLVAGWEANLIPNAPISGLPSSYLQEAWLNEKAHVLHPIAQTMLVSAKFAGLGGQVGLV